jgi:hypothetical protein
MRSNSATQKRLRKTYKTDKEEDDMTEQAPVYPAEEYRNEIL